MILGRLSNKKRELRKEGKRRWKTQITEKSYNNIFNRFT